MTLCLLNLRKINITVKKLINMCNFLLQGPFKSPLMDNLYSQKRKLMLGLISPILETKFILNSTLLKGLASKMKKALQSPKGIHLLKSSNDCFLLSLISKRKKTTDPKTINLFWIIMTKEQHFINPNPIIKISL